MKKIIVISLLLISVLAAPFLYAKQINAGPIWNQRDANYKCPSVCAARNRTWTGNWVTTDPGRMSVCKCKRRDVRYKKHHSLNINAGPIWNQGDANYKCPRVCTSVRKRWNGEWETTVPGRMSICKCR